MIVLSNQKDKAIFQQYFVTAGLSFLDQNLYYNFYTLNVLLSCIQWGCELLAVDK